MCPPQTDTKKNQPALLQPSGTFQRQNLAEKGLNWLYRISAVAGALVFVLSIGIPLLVIWVKLQPTGGPMGEMRREREEQKLLTCESMSLTQSVDQKQM